MATIDKGEKHLFKRRLLESDDSVIAWDDIVDVAFSLSQYGERVVKTWTKEAGDVERDGESNLFELDSSDLRPGFYYIKAELVVNDSQWDSGTSKDVTWETDKIEVLSAPNAQNSSSSQADIKFDVVVESAVTPPTDIPTQASFSTSHTTATTASLPYTSVSGATRYDIQIESTGEVIDNGSSTTIDLTGLTPNTTDRWRVRAANSAGETNYSPYQSFTTNPATTPSVFVSVDRDVATFTIANPLGLDVEINNGSWVNEGNVTQIVVSGLAEGASLSSLFRFRNAGGPGPETTVSYQTTERPQSAPTITATDPNPGFNQVNINVISGIDSVEYRLDAGTPVDVGLTSQFNATGAEGTFNLEVRYTNEWGGGDWSDVEVITILENVAPTVSDPTLAPTNLTISGFTLPYVKATDNKPDSELAYKYYEGDPALLNDVSTIETQQLRQQNTDADPAQFSVLATEGDVVSGNVLVKDKAGNKSIYEAFIQAIPERSIESVKIPESDFMLDEGGIETFDFSVDVIGQNGADETVTVTSSDPSIVAITSLTATTYRATLQTPISEQVSVNIEAVSDFDSLQKDTITATCIPHTLDTEAQSDIYEFETVA